MAVTVNTRTNPTPLNIGTDASKATTIISGFTTGVVTYQIQAKDESSELITVLSDITVTDYPEITSVNATRLNIIVRGRIQYKARAKQDAGAYTAWVNFKSRDKVYTTPDAITQLSDDNQLNAVEKGSVTINVTNSARSSEVDSSTGTEVTLNDFGYVTTTNIEYTDAGATVTNNE